jgi:hypothetical protein
VSCWSSRIRRLSPWVALQVSSQCQILERLGDEKVLGQNRENGINGCVFRRHQYHLDLEEFNWKWGEYVKACSVNILCEHILHPICLLAVLLLRPSQTITTTRAKHYYTHWPLYTTNLFYCLLSCDVFVSVLSQILLEQGYASHTNASVGPLTSKIV